MRRPLPHIDLGLALLRLIALPGQEYTLQEIATWAGCSPENIRQIEAKALAKIAPKMKGLEYR